MKVENLDPVTDPRWSTLVARHRGGLFHSPPWLGAVRDAYGFPLEAVVVLDDEGQPLAGLPFAMLDGPLAPRLVAAPFCDRCDPLFSHRSELDQLIGLLEARGLPVVMRCLDDVELAPSFVVIKRARWHTIPLAKSEDTRWKMLAPPTRRAIQKARRHGVEVRPLLPGTDLAAFHHLHVMLRKRKYSLLAQPLQFFEAIATRFLAVDGWHALGAWINGRLVAATIFLRWDDTLYYKFNASALDELDARPNSLLTWEGMTLAATLGCSLLDLGPSDDDQPGLSRFKRHFGADERELRFLRRDPPGWNDAPRLGSQQLLGEVTRLLTFPDIPDHICAKAGAQLYRYFA